MKISKIPSLGRFGHYIDDLDFDHLSDEEWQELGQLHLRGLVTIIRGANCSTAEFERRVLQWGEEQNLAVGRIQNRYGTQKLDQLLDHDHVNGVPVDPLDREWIQQIRGMIGQDPENPQNTSLIRVTGRKDDEGRPLGMFAEGELLWHSNESGDPAYTPGVALYAWEGVRGSATGFVTTTDWYESQTEATRSELDDMIIEHRFTPGRINPGLRAEQDLIMYRNMCPEPSTLPLVQTSPGGDRGLHFSVNTIDRIEGMTLEESEATLKWIRDGIMTPHMIYDHWYENDRDICLFDNSITLHRRLGGIANRMCYRIQYNQCYLSPNWQPYTQVKYQDIRQQRLEEYQRAKALT